MSLTFVLRPPRQAYWRMADDYENTAIDSFCELNGLNAKSFRNHRYVPEKAYTPVTNRNCKVYVSNWRLILEDVTQTPGGNNKVSVRLYKKCFIDPRLRPETFPCLTDLKPIEGVSVREQELRAWRDDQNAWAEKQCAEKHLQNVTVVEYANANKKSMVYEVQVRYDLYEFILHEYVEDEGEVVLLETLKVEVKGTAMNFYLIECDTNSKITAITLSHDDDERNKGPLIHFKTKQYIHDKASDVNISTHGYNSKILKLFLDWLKDIKFVFDIDLPIHLDENLVESTGSTTLFPPGNHKVYFQTTTRRPSVTPTHGHV